jgi:hypothetical protein
MIMCLLLNIMNNLNITSDKFLINRTQTQKCQLDKHPFLIPFEEMSATQVITPTVAPKV